MIAADEAVDIYSDSQLVVKTITRWAKGWAARGWQRKAGPVANLQLVQQAVFGEVEPETFQQAGHDERSRSG